MNDTVKCTQRLRAGVLLFSLCSLLPVASCGRGGGKTVADTDPTAVDSLADHYALMAWNEPARARNEVLKLQASTADSLDFYTLETAVASSYTFENNTDSAIISQESILRFCERHAGESFRLDYLYANTINNLAVSLCNAGKYDDAIHYAQDAIEAFRRVGYSGMSLNAFQIIAEANAEAGKQAESIDAYRKGIHLIDSLGMGNSNLLSFYAGMGKVYTDIQNYAMADHYFSLVEEQFDSLPNKHYFANVRQIYYYNLRDYENFSYWLRKAYKESLEEGYPFDIAVDEANFGEYYILTGKPDSARYFLDKASAMLSNSPSNMYYLNGLYGALHLLEGDLAGAERRLSALADTEGINPVYVYYNQQRLAELHERRGDYRRALHYQKIAKTLGDSLRDIKIHNNMAEIESRYRQDTTLLRKDVIIANSDRRVAELNTQRTLSLSLLVFLVAAGSGIALFIRKKRLQDYTRQMAAITALRMENVRNRMSPHFVFNALNAMMPSLRQHEELEKPVKLLTQSIRGNLRASEKTAITLGEELELVRNYLSLVESIGEKKIQVDWNIDPGVEMQTLLPSMCIQIPVENAVKYAFADDTGNRLSITVSSDNGHLRIVIEDNGPGFDTIPHNAGDKGTGSGLKILYGTISLLNSKNKHKISFDIGNPAPNDGTNTPRGVRATITIPFEYSFDRLL